MRFAILSNTTKFLALILIGSSLLLTKAHRSSYAVAQDDQKATTPPTRRSLLIGINTYKPDQNITSEASGPKEKLSQRRKPAAVSKGDAGGRAEFSNLDGPRNDVEEMQAVIQGKYGFTDIRRL